MLKLKLGTEVFEYPTQASEIKLGKYIDFIKEQDKFFKWQSEYEKDGVGFQIGYVRWLLKLIYQFADLPKKKLKSFVKIGPFKRHLARLTGVKKFAQVDLDGTEKTLIGLYEKTRFFIDEYQPRPFGVKDFVFKYKGETYTIKGFYRDEISGDIRYDNMPIGEGVEAMEVVRALNNLKEDVNGNNTFTYLLQLIAIAAKKQGDEFPTSEVAIGKYISQRTIYFEDVSMEVALTVKDFFFGTMKALKKIQDITTSLTRQSRKKAGNMSKKRKGKTKESLIA